MTVEQQPISRRTFLKRTAATLAVPVAAGAELAWRKVAKPYEDPWTLRDTLQLGIASLPVAIPALRWALSIFSGEGREKEPVPPKDALPPQEVFKKKGPSIFRFSRQFVDMNLNRRHIQLNNDFESWLRETTREEEDFSDEKLVTILVEKAPDFREAKRVFWHMVEVGTLEQALAVFNKVLGNPPKRLGNGEDNIFFRPDVALGVVDLILRRDVMRDGRQTLTAQEEGAFEAFFTNISQTYNRGASAFAERRQSNWYEQCFARSVRNLFNDHSELLYGLGGRLVFGTMREIKSLNAFEELASACGRFAPKDAALALAMSINLPGLVAGDYEKEHVFSYEEIDIMEKAFECVVRSLSTALENRRGDLSEVDKMAVTVFLRLTEAVLPKTVYNQAFFMTSFYRKHPEFGEATLSRNPLAEQIDLSAIKKRLAENPLTDSFWQDLRVGLIHKSRKN